MKTWSLDGLNLVSPSSVKTCKWRKNGRNATALNASVHCRLDYYNAISAGTAATLIKWLVSYSVYISNPYHIMPIVQVFTGSESFQDCLPRVEMCPWLYSCTSTGAVRPTGKKIRGHPHFTVQSASPRYTPLPRVQTSTGRRNFAFYGRTVPTTILTCAQKRASSQLSLYRYEHFLRMNCLRFRFVCVSLIGPVYLS